MIRPEMSNLIDRRNKLLKTGSERTEINNLEVEISDMEAEINRNKIMKYFKSYNENPESVNLNQVWKTLDKIYPKTQTKIPIAKKNHQGKVFQSRNN